MLLNVAFVIMGDFKAFSITGSKVIRDPEEIEKRKKIFLGIQAVILKLKEKGRIE